jgi:hypothetical protein
MLPPKKKGGSHAFQGPSSSLLSPPEDRRMKKRRIDEEGNEEGLGINEGGTNGKEGWNEKWGMGMEICGMWDGNGNMGKK